MTKEWDLWIARSRSQYAQTLYTANTIYIQSFIKTAHVSMPMNLNQLTYWQTSYSFCHNTRILQTDGWTDGTAVCCIICSCMLKIQTWRSGRQLPNGQNAVVLGSTEKGDMHAEQEILIALSISTAEDNTPHIRKQHWNHTYSKFQLCNMTHVEALYQVLLLYFWSEALVSLTVLYKLSTLLTYLLTWSLKIFYTTE